MTTAIKNIAKSMVSEIESINEAALISKIIEAIDKEKKQKEMQLSQVNPNCEVCDD